MIFPCVFLLAPAPFFGGCASGPAYPQYMRPGLLYLKDQPYRRLYVEVDMVEGAEVPQKGTGSYVCLLLAPRDKESAGPRIEAALAALTKAAEDPCPVTRTVAHGLLEEMKKKPLSPASAAATPEAQ